MTFRAKYVKDEGQIFALLCSEGKAGEVLDTFERQQKYGLGIDQDQF